MNNKLFIPSCHKFITKKDGTANFQRIYGVLKSAYSTKYPNDTLSSEEVFDFLKLNQIVPHDFPHQDIDFDYQELCFSIITQYKCNSICQLCPYSSLYKNIYENEESILLSYALNSWDHLNSLKKAGLTCRHFRSMIPVSDKSKVLVVPLNRLAYEYLETVPSSANDFGKNIIPTMLENGEKMVSFRFEGYWKDVGTIHSLWEANMDLVDQPPKFDLNDRSWSIYSRNMALAPHYVGQNAKITNSTVTEGCFIDGEIKHSVIFGGVELGEGSVVSDSVIMPGAKIGKNVVIEKAVIGADAVIGDGAKVGVNSSDDNKYASKLCTNDLVLIESGAEVGVEEDICKGSMVEA